MIAKKVGFLSNVRQVLRDNFLAGLFIAVPFAITVGFLMWVWSYIDDPLRQFFHVATRSNEAPWHRLVSAKTNDEIIVPVAGLLLLLLLLLGLGIIARSIIGRIALASAESAVSHLPIVGVLYTSVKQLGEAFVSKEGQSKFERAVAVQFPLKGSWAIGFVTGKGDALQDAMPKDHDLAQKSMLTVFVPTSPLPTAGFMLLVPESECVALDMPVQDALRMVVSGGIIGPGESRRANKPGRITTIMTQSIRPQVDSASTGNVTQGSGR